MKVYDKTTGFFVADPEVNPLGGAVPTYAAVRSSAETLILSASGWRKVFAESGDEEDTGESISPEDTVIAGIMALAFSRFIKGKTGKQQPAIAVGMDSRYTGPAICDIMSRIFLSENIKQNSLFITAAPEIMAYTAVTPGLDGFAYISASHNPVGHNGLKFGLGGGVIGGSGSRELIGNFRALLDDPDIVTRIVSLSSDADTAAYHKVLSRIESCKQEAYTAYLSFSRRTIAGSKDPVLQDTFFSTLAAAAKEHPLGVVGELNGSARTLSIDREILSAGGVTFLSYNDSPREIVHRIVPEGLSLDPCRHLLEEAHAQDNAFVLGYVPDNDGDRGNIVYMDEMDGSAKILEAQEVFALAVLGELCFLSAAPPPAQDGQPCAVVVNGPTSMRIDRIADYFGVETFRAEVGEANAVTLAENLRARGYVVRILGEGSNGGNITHPAKVRDPINTVFALLKLLLYTNPVTGEDLFKLWCSASRQSDAYKSSFSLKDIIDTLPVFTTTSAYEKRAVMKIATTDHGMLKKRYESLFLKEWSKKKAYLAEQFGIVRWKEINYEGTEAREGMGSTFRSGSERGGLKIVFLNREGRETDYIWMRGSGTEPVFRILADCQGSDTERENWFLNWHRSMIERADKGETV